MFILIPPSLQKLKLMFYRLAYLGQSQKKQNKTKNKTKVTEFIQSHHIHNSIVFKLGRSTHNL